MAAVKQAEKMHWREFKWNYLHEKRAYLIAQGAEIREGLRDTLSARTYEFNNVMLCDTVCLGASFALVVEGSPPETASTLMLALYVAVVASAIAMFIVSLWCSVIVTRRLNFRSAGELELIFAKEKEASFATDYILNKQWETMEWYTNYLDQHTGRLGGPAKVLMPCGVVLLFIAAGLLIQMRFVHVYDTAAPFVCFWVIATTSVSVICSLEYAERQEEKRKQGVYNKELYRGQNEAGSKITRKLEEMAETAEKKFIEFDMEEDELTVKFPSLDSIEAKCAAIKVNTDERNDMRSKVKQLITSGDVQTDKNMKDDDRSDINDVLNLVKQADDDLADNVVDKSDGEGQCDSESDTEGDSKGWAILRAKSTRHDLQIVLDGPLDARVNANYWVQEPVLKSVRNFVGESYRSTILRIKNFGDEPLTHKRGELHSGSYVERWTYPKTEESFLFRCVYR